MIRAFGFLVRSRWLLALAVALAPLMASPSAWCSEGAKVVPDRSESSDRPKVGDYLKLRHREQPAPKGMPVEGNRNESELLLSLPVTEGLRVKSGLRLDYRTPGGAGLASAGASEPSRNPSDGVEAIPTLGFEVRF